MKFSVCGKGGSGKSTLVALLARAARKRGLKVLVVDADESNSGLFRMLGLPKPPVPLMDLLGGRAGLKRKMGEKNIFSEATIAVGGIPLPYIVHGEGMALVAVGKIHQALEGCACPMGALNREFLKKLLLAPGEVAFVDMEAGIEHFGRGVEEGIDGVVLVVEPSLESITLAEKVKELTSGLSKPLWAVLNKVSSEALAARLREEVEGRRIDVIGAIPYDEGVFEACLMGRAIGEGEALKEAEKVLDILLEVRDGVDRGAQALSG